MRRIGIVDNALFNGSAVEKVKECNSIDFSRSVNWRGGEGRRRRRLVS